MESTTPKSDRQALFGPNFTTPHRHLMSVDSLPLRSGVVDAALKLSDLGVLLGRQLVAAFGV